MSQAPSSPIEALLSQIHEELAKTLLDRILSGEATSQDLNVARQLLRDNGIDATPRKGGALLNLAQSLPFKDKDVG